MSVQTVLAGSGVSQYINSGKDLDFLASCLHARHSRMFEVERLDALCRIRNFPEFVSMIFPKSEIKEILDFQKSLIHEFISELSGFRAYVSDAGTDLIDWILVRFQMENIKILLRACFNGAPIGEIEKHLIVLPAALGIDKEKLATAQSAEDFIYMLPKGLLRESMKKALKTYSDYPGTFFFEAALDCYYFRGLLARMEKLTQEEREIVSKMFYQEVDIFHFMLVARGKFHYRLTSELLLPLHVKGARISRALFSAMLNDPDVNVVVDRVAGRIFDAASFEYGSSDENSAFDIPAFEFLLWNRFFHLSLMAFRRSHMGLGAIAGYAGLRRVEVANLITISEGILSDMPAEVIRRHLIPKIASGGVDV